MHLAKTQISFDIWRLSLVFSVDRKKVSHKQENLSSGFPTSFDTNQAVQPQKMARNWEFLIWVVEEW